MLLHSDKYNPVVYSYSSSPSIYHKHSSGRNRAGADGGCLLIQRAALVLREGLKYPIHDPCSNTLLSRYIPNIPLSINLVAVGDRDRRLITRSLNDTGTDGGCLLIQRAALGLREGLACPIYYHRSNIPLPGSSLALSINWALWGAGTEGS